LLVTQRRKDTIVYHLIDLDTNTVLASTKSLRTVYLLLGYFGRRNAVAWLGW
jgi:hypothetical protein